LALGAELGITIWLGLITLAGAASLFVASLAQSWHIRSGVLSLIVFVFAFLLSLANLGDT
ncbi:MAG: hypothetical protein AAGC77_13270, partial [Pseudomonadota bacterium]